jgi:putative transposase
MELVYGLNYSLRHHRTPFVGFPGRRPAHSIFFMAKAVRTPRAGVSYVSSATHDRRPIFETSRNAALFIETLLHFRTRGRYKLHAYIVLPDQVHLLLTPQSITLDHAMELIRTGFADQMEADQPVWAESFTSFPVANIHDLEVVRAYLHQMPVRVNLVSSAELYPYSSAYRALPAYPLSAPTPRAQNSGAEPDRKPAESTATSLRKVAS